MVLLLEVDHETAYLIGGALFFFQMQKTTEVEVWMFRSRLVSAVLQDKWTSYNDLSAFFW